MREPMREPMRERIDARADVRSARAASHEPAAAWVPAEGSEASTVEPGRGQIPSAVEQQRFVADLRRFVADVERLIGQVRSLTGDGAVVARWELDRRIAQARRGLVDVRLAATERADAARERAERYLRDEPWKGLAVAAAAGVVAGLLLTRRRR